MTTLQQIIKKHNMVNLAYDEMSDFERDILKYAEQEPCENCDYSEIMDWEQDAKTGKAKPIYWCERHKEPCDDVVSRQAVLDLAKKGILVSNGSYLSVCKAINELPSVRPQEQTGHWIRQNNTKEPLYGWYFCSECKSVIGDKTKFCSNCGARMVEPQESEEKK